MVLGIISKDDKYYASRLPPVCFYGLLLTNDLDNGTSPFAKFFQIKLPPLSLSVTNRSIELGL